MTISMYAITVPPFERHLSGLDALLDKAAAYAAAKKFDPAVLLASRLYPDMFALARQVQLASDHAKGGTARPAGLPVPSFPDTETTIPELKDRIGKTLAFLKSVTPAQLDGSEARTFTIKTGGAEVTVNGLDYVLNYAMPNFYFHCTTAYDILRHNGVEIGKRDFLNRK